MNTVVRISTNTAKMKGNGEKEITLPHMITIVSWVAVHRAT